MISITYLGVVLMLPVIYQNRRLVNFLPPYPSPAVLIILYLICLIVSIIIMMNFSSASRILSGITICITIFSAVYLNRFNLLYNVHTRQPLIYQVMPGNIIELGAQTWNRDIPFEVYYITFQKHGLNRVLIHPEKRKSEITLLNRLGLYLTFRDDVPLEISDTKFLELKSREDLSYTTIKNGDIEYLIFNPVEEPSELLVTTHNSTTLIIPLILINE